MRLPVLNSGVGGWVLVHSENVFGMQESHAARTHRRTYIWILIWISDSDLDMDEYSDPVKIKIWMWTWIVIRTSFQFLLGRIPCG